MAIERIGILATASELYDRQDTPTGDVFVDGVVSVLREVPHPSVRQIAELLGVNRNMLSKVIELRTGRNLNDLLEYWTWRKAKHLLTETDMPFDEVAHACGFASSAVLLRFVDRLAGNTLVELRTNKSRRRWRQNLGYV